MNSSFKRVKATITYNGYNYNGFQRQPNSFNSIQAQIELALKKWLKKDVEIQGSGRTDARVHAIGQVISFSIEMDISEYGIKCAINNFLPVDIRIVDVSFVASDFHARYHAKVKHYCYKINTNDYNVFEYDRVYQYCNKLDIDRMRECANLFIGKHDFYAFCKNLWEENTIRHVYSIEISISNGIVAINLTGKGFLRHMVRTIVQTLIMYQKNRITSQRIEYLLNHRDEKVGYCSAPEGLYLMAVKYD